MNNFSKLLVTVVVPNTKTRIDYIGNTMSKSYRVFTESFTIYFFSNAVKTENLRGIQILKDHLLKIIYINN